jgi:ribosomal protein L31
MPKTLKALEKSLEYKNLVDLQAVHAEATARINELSADLQTEWLALVDDKRADYAHYQSAITETVAALEILCRKHPEWFGKKRSIKTPYGIVQFRGGTKLESDNEELSVVLIEQAYKAELERNHVVTDEPSPLLKTVTVLNLEALEKFTDAELDKFRIKRIKTDNFSVVANTVDLGKAVEDAASAEKEAA